MYYEEIFAQRVPPPRIRLIHRMLPIRRQAIDAHGDAILAAADALEATGDEFQRTGQGLGAVLAGAEQLQRERRLFVAAVRQYNCDIAEYLLNVAPLGTSEQTLVSKMILVNGQRTPEPAPSGGGNRTFAPPDDATSARPNAPPGVPSAARQRTTEYQPHDAQPPGDEGLYSVLAQLERGQAASKLTELLHWSRAAPEEAGQPTSLSDCLRGATPAARRTLITAYWHAREQAARYQVLSEQSEQLGALSAVVIGARDTPGMAEAGVRAQAMRRSARAALLDAQAALVDSQFMLTQVAGRPLERPWLFPETPPQAHHGAAASAAGSRPTHTPSARFLELQEARVDELAHAVIQADAARATLVAEAHSSSTPPADQPVVLDLIVQAVGSQTEHTLAFLHSLTDYNLAVAEHVLVTLPANTPGDELARQLAPERGSPDKS
jgi:hypothetical protein